MKTTTFLTDENDHEEEYTIEYRFEKGERESRWQPGCSDEIEIIHVWDEAGNLTKKFDNNKGAMADIEKACWVDLKSEMAEINEP